MDVSSPLFVPLPTAAFLSPRGLHSNRRGVGGTSHMAPIGEPTPITPTPTLTLTVMAPIGEKTTWSHHTETPLYSPQAADVSAQMPTFPQVNFGKAYKGVRRASLKSNSGVADSRSGSYFERHLPLSALQSRVVSGAVLCGIFESSSYGSGSVSGLTYNVALETAQACNRALPGNVVAVELSPGRTGQLSHGKV